MKCTSFKCRDWVFQTHIATQTLWWSTYRTFPSPQKRSPVSLCSPDALPWPLATTETFFLHRSACPRSSYKLNHTGCTFMSGFLHFMFLRFRSAVLCISSVVFLTVVLWFHDTIQVHEYYSLVVHSALHGRLTYYAVLAMMNIAPMNSNVHISVWTHVFISLGVKCWGQGVLNVVGSCQTDLRGGCTILHLHWQSTRRSCCPTFSPVFSVISFWGHSRGGGGGGMLSPWGLTHTSLINNDAEHSFQVFLGYSFDFLF